MFQSFRKLAFTGIIGLTVLSSCQKDKVEDPIGDPIQVSKHDVVTNYSSIVYATYSDALKKAKDLKVAVDALVATPTQKTLDAARTAYIESREPYGQSDAFRFYGGPIDDENGREGFMNGWPLDEAYIDYVEGDTDAGIIRDKDGFYPVIDTTMLRNANQDGGEETYISTGYHAIEFLLWGQDLSETGPGNRPYTDYIEGVGPDAKRRGQYLKAVVDLLIADLTYTANAWAPGAAYRTTFEAKSDTAALALIMTGMGKFTKGELFGERMSTAYETHDQEDEHSCFSDQTHRDFILGQKSNSNVFYGSYTRVDGSVISGASIYDLINTANATKASEAKTAFTNATNAAGAIHAPFDQEIKSADGRVRVLNAITAGNTQATKISAVAEGLGIKITL